MKTTTSPRRRPGASMRIAAWALSALLVWGQLPVAAVAQAAQQPAAFAQEAADGQTADPAGQVTLALRVIGPEGVLWLPRTRASFARGTTLEEAVKQMLDAAGIGYDASLLTLTRDGQSYGWDGSNYWQFFVADKSLEVMPGDYELTEPVTDAALYYSPWGASLPTAPVECDPDAPHPDVEAFWPAWRGPASTGAIARDATPTGAGTLAWSLRLREADDWATNVSDPVFVDGSLWVAAGSQLLYVDPASGTVAARLPLAAPIDSTCRITYAQGLLLVPLSGGRLQAISASAHKTLWVTDALPADGTVPQQSLSSLTVAEDAVYWATCTPDGVGGSTGGYLCAANLATGALLSGYPRANPRGAGVYWSGPVQVTGRYGLMACGDDVGTLEIYDAATGTPKGSLNLGAPVRTTPVSLGDGALAVVTSNGVAHRISVAQDGTPTQAAACSFATSSTSTPALAGDTLVVGGAVADATGYHGRLALIDVASFSVTRTVDATAAGPFPEPSRARRWSARLPTAPGLTSPATRCPERSAATSWATSRRPKSTCLPPLTSSIAWPASSLAPTARSITPTTPGCSSRSLPIKPSLSSRTAPRVPAPPRSPMVRRGLAALGSLAERRSLTARRRVLLLARRQLRRLPRASGMRALGTAQRQLALTPVPMLMLRLPRLSMRKPSLPTALPLRMPRCPGGPSRLWR